MNIKLYFNFILLGLCLTTLFITLITYIIFRLRYSFKSKVEDGLHRMEGQFFRRFAPHLKKENDAILNKYKNKITDKLSFKMKLTYMSASIFLLIIGVLASEHFLVFRTELNKRAQSATTFRELLDKGLLKTYEFSPYAKEPQIKESISDNEILQLTNMAKDISKYNYTVFSNELNEIKSVGHKVSIKKWESFFKRHNIKYNKVTRLYNAKPNHVWVLPNYQRILAREKVAFEEHLKNGGRVIITGALGVFEEKSDNEDFSWFEKVTGLKIIKENINNKLRPSIFVAKGAPLWNLPPGLTLRLDVEKNNYSFLSHDENVKAFETDYQSNLIKYNGYYGARYKIIDDYERDIVWTQYNPVFDPDKNSSNETQSTHYYSDSIFLHSLNWISDNTIAKVSNWPKGKAFSSVLSVDAESKFDNIESLISDLKDYDLPVTIFAVSQLYNEFPEAFNELLKDIDEVGSHSDDHKVMPDFTLFENFKRLQKSRLDIEQLYHKEVLGFRPPEERFNEETLNALVQNKFNYIFAGQNFYRYSPVFLEGSDLLYYPRVVSDDFAISKNPLLSTAEKVSDLMKEELKKVELFGGSYLFSMHTHIFGDQEFYKQGMKHFYRHLVKQNVWNTTFKDMTSWWKSKRQLNLKIEKTNSSSILVTNNGDAIIKDIVIRVRNGKLESKRMPTSDDKASLIKSIEIQSIGPGETKRLQVD